MSPASPSATTTWPRRVRRAVTLAVLGSVAALIAWSIIYLTISPGAAEQPGASDQAPAQSDGAATQIQEDEHSDDRFRRLVVGVWQDEYQGKRTMTLRPDGTGTMVVEMSGWKATLYASRLQFEMTWAVEGGRLKKRTVGGEPAAQVHLILRMIGDCVDERILELNEERLLLLDQNGETKYDWRRVAE